MFFSGGMDSICGSRKLQATFKKFDVDSLELRICHLRFRGRVLPQVQSGAISHTP